MGGGQLMPAAKLYLEAVLLAKQLWLVHQLWSPDMFSNFIPRLNL